MLFMVGKDNGSENKRAPFKRGPIFLTAMPGDPTSTDFN